MGHFLNVLSVICALLMFFLQPLHLIITINSANRLTLTNGYYIGKYEVTQALWKSDIYSLPPNKNAEFYFVPPNKNHIFGQQ